MTDKKRTTDELEDSLNEKGMKNRVSGTADQLAGKARNTLGAITDDTGEQVKGKAQELKGDIKEALGKVQMNAARAMDRNDKHHKKS
jgi:uncharacterized protein YjbJ (UPF0337 family)